MTDAVSPDVAESVGASVKISASEGAGPRAAAGPISARRWSNEEKARIVEESERPGVALRDVAQRHGVSAQSLREWRRQAALAAAGCRPGSGRPWPDDVKARIVAECEEAGVRLGDVARRHGVSEKTLRKWRRLPDSKTGGRAVPLAPSAVRLLKSLPRGEENPWVIAGKKPESHLTDLQHPWRRIRARAELDDVRIHDLRHSFASRALALGEGLPMIGKLLGHTQVQTTARYAHLARDTVKASAARIGDSIDSDLDLAGEPSPAP